jgi:cysteine synthase A
LVADLGGLDILVGATGSGGSLCGTARALRELVPSVHTVAVDCVGSVLFDQPDQPHRLQSGLGNSVQPPNLDHGVLDEVHWLNDREAFAGTADLAAQQKIFAGNTSGSVYMVLRHLAAHSEPRTRIVGIFADRGDRYAQTVYDTAHHALHRVHELPQRTTPERVHYGAPVSSWSYAAVTRESADAVLVGVH